MAFDGNGTFNRPVSPYVFDTVISETDVNTEMDGIATGLSTCLTTDGQSTATARIDFAQGIATDTIAEITAAVGVTIDGVLLKDSQVTTDIINEKTATAGVTVDGVLLKDGGATLKDSVTQFQDDSDATKQMRFQLSGITTATTRTVTVPDASGTIAYQSRSIATTSPLSGGGDLSADRTITFIAPLFNCQLTKVSTNLQLDRCNGSWLFINGANVQIPQAGVSLSPSGLTLNTSYYIYAYLSTGTMTLEASTTAPAIDTTYGHPIKTGDGTRSLVGACFVLTGPAFADSTTQRYVVSYYNKRKIVGISTAVGPLTTSATSPTLIGSSPVVQYMYWSAFPVTVAITGNMSNNSGGNYADAYLRLGGVIQTLGQSRAYSGLATEAGPIALYGVDGAGGTGLTVATGQLDLAGQVAVTGTASYFQISATAEIMG